MIASVSLLGAASYAAFKFTTTKPVETEEGQKHSDPSQDRKLFTRGEVRKHTSKEAGIYVTRGDAVYDITDFVDVHPGGERILLAAGHSIDPFWHIFAIHQTTETLELLETYRIGDLMPAKDDPTYSALRDDAAAALERLFYNDPVRDPQLIVRSDRPCNAETPPHLLTEAFVTPNNLFFVRNHLPVPETDQITTVEFDAPWLPETVVLSLDEIKGRYEHVDVMTTLQCAGNRRKEMHDVKPVKGAYRIMLSVICVCFDYCLTGLQWTQGAISNAVWTGIPLRKVIEDVCGPIPKEYEDKIKHVHFQGAEGYGASIPVHKALDPRGDVILTFKMNGEDLPRDHGWPIRALVPGHVAARSVKWVQKVTLAEEESPSHWQQRDYKGFGPSKTLEQSRYDESVAIQELPVQSAITLPRAGDTVPVRAGEVRGVKGFAWSGGGRGIVRVDVSADGGQTWVDARLRKPGQMEGREWAWTLWEADVPVNVAEGEDVEIVCKAVDTSYNEQPERFDSTYNVRGVLVSAWHRVRAAAKIEQDEGEKK
ncbi:Oxidoreductase, molybdopterin-binding domain-containing protein [Chytriomyces sp. MP71]|nr:Oxidoreductase, molybdopterin-binding domain-containing protein [Chytriomyces sp. MP71]